MEIVSVVILVALALLAVYGVVIYNALVLLCH